MASRAKEFVEQLKKRNPVAYERYVDRTELATAPMLEGAPAVVTLPQLKATPETIVSDERPVLFVQHDRIVRPSDEATLGIEAKKLVGDLVAAKSQVEPLFPLVGRIDAENFPGPFAGTGWFVARDIVVTNRHVASLIARWDGLKFVFTQGVDGLRYSPTLCTAHEHEGGEEVARVFSVKEVLFIESESSPHDIAFLRVERTTNGAQPTWIEVSPTDGDANATVCVIGYPAKASKRTIPDTARMNRMYYGAYDVKRVAPGLLLGLGNPLGSHDCTTLGGNSGSVVVDVASGKALGLHYAGAYEEANYSVPASVLNDYVTQKRWNRPAVIEARVDQHSAAPPARQPEPKLTTNVAGGSVTITIPITITVGVGTPIVGSPPPPDSSRPAPVEVASVETAASELLAQRIAGVLATRVGFFDADDRIGDVPFIAASVSPDRLATVVQTGPAEFKGIPVRYSPADVSEQLDNRITTEGASSIRYDDDARTGADFSFETVSEEMTAILHVGPEYSWSTLQAFLAGAKGSMVSAMYEFHGPHIADAIEARLEAGLALQLVVDNLTVRDVKNQEEEFDRSERFAKWSDAYGARFKYIVVPEGTKGLIASAYHIKVSVRDDDTFWLSSGNWKLGTSQPRISSAQLDNASEKDLPGNREWHVVMTSPTLAKRFRKHIVQDFKRSKDLRNQEGPDGATDITVLVPADLETIVEERRPPDEVLEPKEIAKRKFKVTPLLTPDREGAVYCDAVLDLIKSAKRSLLFQIPYIAMRPNPRVHRGYIDDLIEALANALVKLDDARVIISGGSKYSDPKHVAWYFKSKRVDIDERLRVMDHHHTKGMVVDGKRVLIGSHNWSSEGVTLNRDASLIFDDRDAALYFARAFNIDWRRANKPRPQKFVKKTPESAAFPVPAFRPMSLADVLALD